MRKTTMLVSAGAVVTVICGAVMAADGGPQPVGPRDAVVVSAPTPSPTATATAPAPSSTPSSSAAPAGQVSAAPADASSSDLDAAIAAAIAEVGPATVIDADRDDDVTHAYEIDLRLDAGGFAEVKLADDLSIVSVELDDRGGDDLDGDSHGDGEVTDPAIRDAASAAALAATDGGTVTSVEASDDTDHVWEVEVDLGDGEDADVELDASFQVLEVD
jgi:hypothetical protein